MSISLFSQGQSFLLALAAGAALGLVYDLLRLLRTARVSRFLQEASDLLFWLLAAAALFLCGTVLEAGRVRLYLLLSMFCGGALYFLLLSPPLRRVLARLTRRVTRAAAWLSAPFRRAWHVLSAQWAKIFGRVRESLKKSFSFFQMWSRIGRLYRSPRGTTQAQNKKQRAY